jgi:penicillin amidase
MNDRALPPPPRSRRRALLAGWLPIGLLAALPLALSSCVVAPPPVASIDSAARVAALPATGHDVAADVDILWDEWLIPCVIAESDADLAYALGVVHVHLRWGQMEFIKRIARGRLAEMAGPPALPIDRGLRTLDMDRVVPEIEASLPDDTRRWIERYVAGVNAARRLQPAVHQDLRALGIDPEEPWTVGDTLAIGRLASADLTWGRWLSLLPRQDDTGFADFRDRLRAFADDAVPSFGPGEPVPLAELFTYGRTGSNSVVVSAARTGTGSAMIASDPHLGLPQPNLWMIACLRSPGTRAIGFTIPGLPFVLEGRNDRIAWGGTNMQNVTSQLVDVSGEDPSSFTPRTERIGVRWWFDDTFTARDSRFGPVMTDLPLLDGLAGPGGAASAIRWRGHEPSDESTAFLLAMRAADWPGFRAAFAHFRSGGQNMLYADVDGHIGQVLATEWIPAAAATAWDAPVAPADAGDWTARIPSDRLPAAFDPPAGFIASANNTPILTDPPMLTQGNSNDRMVRMTELLAGDDTITVDRLMALQRDTFSRASLRAAGRIVAHAVPDPTDPAADTAATLVAALAAWDGFYETDSHGAVAYMRVLDALIDDLYADRYSKALRRTMRNAPYVHEFIAADLAGEPGVPPAVGPTTAAVRAAIATAAREYDPQQTWGDIHRLDLAHPIGAVPLLGRPWNFDERPTAGSTTTIFKSAHAVTGKRHATTFGANARHVSDLSDPDANWFVLVGGQDGRPGSANMLDQADVWLRGEMIPVPFTEAAWRKRAVRTTTLRSGD